MLLGSISVFFTEKANIIMLCLSRSNLLIWEIKIVDDAGVEVEILD